MKRRSFYVFLAASLAMLIPAPGRFIYGLILTVELNLLMVTGTIFYNIFQRLKLKELSSFATMFIVIAIAVCYKQILNFILPEASLVLGFIIYLLPVSIFFIGYLYSNLQGTVKQRLRINFVHILTFSIYALLFFLFRDILGYGTITYISNFSIVEKILIPADTIGVFTVIASIPGALFISSVLLFIHIFIRNKFNILRNAEVAE